MTQELNCHAKSVSNKRDPHCLRRYQCTHFSRRWKEWCLTWYVLFSALCQSTSLKYRIPGFCHSQELLTLFLWASEWTLAQCHVILEGKWVSTVEFSPMYFFHHKSVAPVRRVATAYYLTLTIECFPHRNACAASPPLTLYEWISLW